MTALEVEYDAGLVEAAVLATVASRRVERTFRRERDPLYEAADAEAREAAFRTLHAHWFLRLGLDGPFHRALDELPDIARRCERCLVMRATGGSDEAADLRGVPSTPPTVLILVRPDTVGVPERLLAFLRHELLHVADMLDPRFAYALDFPGDEAAPYGWLLRERYRALWDAFVDGRLARRGHAPASVHAERLREFEQAFPALGDRAQGEFERFFGAAELTHAELVAFARSGSVSRIACPLCCLPTRVFETTAERLPRAVIEAIVADFPAWTPAAGLCSRCAELYGSRPHLAS